MPCGFRTMRGLLTGFAAIGFFLSFGFGAYAQTPLDRESLVEPIFRVPKQAAQQQDIGSGVKLVAGEEQEHPLMPAIRLAKKGLARIDSGIHDYSATLIKREEIDGKVGEYEYMFTKVRHEPLSVYMYFLKPSAIRGREVIYVDGRNEGKMVAHEGGIKGKLLPTVNLDPTGLLAMRGQRYPITEVGIRNLTARLVQVAEHDAQFGECEVKFFEGAKINGRTCTCIQVIHPVPRKEFTFHLARVFIDDELQIPVRYEAYGWPAQPGDVPPLQEEYTYMNVKLNEGFTDADFDRENAQYNF